jgi:hypothetical protein
VAISSVRNLTLAEGKELGSNTLHVAERTLACPIVEWDRRTFPSTPEDAPPLALFRIRVTPAVDLGTVEAPDSEAAIKVGKAVVSAGSLCRLLGFGSAAGTSFLPSAPADRNQRPGCYAGNGQFGGRRGAV